LRERARDRLLRSAASSAATRTSSASRATIEGHEERLEYDHLIVALGSVSRTLPIPGLAEHAIGFKSLPEAIALRNHVIRTLEAAETLDDPDERRRWLSYVFVGGGYAGVEGLAELQDFAADAIERYPRCRTQGMRWVLVDAADRIMRETPPDLGAFTERELRGRGIEIRPARRRRGHRSWVRLSTGEQIPTHTMVWTAGVKPHPVVAELGLPLDRGGPHPGRLLPAGRRLPDACGRSATPPPSPIPRRTSRHRRRPPRSTRSARASSPPRTSPRRSPAAAASRSATRPRASSSTSGAARRSPTRWASSGAARRVLSARRTTWR
jgi:NADH dehydrogenase